MSDILNIKFDDIGSMRLRKSEKYSNNSKDIYQCQISFLKTSVSDMLTVIRKTQSEISSYIDRYNLENKNLKKQIIINHILGKKTHRIIAANASFLEQVEYLTLIGLRPEIISIEGLQDAISFCQFNEELKLLNIKNDITKNTKRIHAVHPLYVHDTEIREGLRVSVNKHPDDNPLYVNSVAALETAFKLCKIGTTLIIDGHWVHDNVSAHGVWDPCNAEVLSEHIANLVNANAGKITKINLLGCESGTIRNGLETVIYSDRLYSRKKEYSDPDANIAEFRRRVVYIPKEQESIFDEKSLAYHVIKKIKDKSVIVSATPSLGYPYPPTCPRINIASDAPSWDQKHFWNENGRSQIYNFCRNTKSTTQQIQSLDEKKYVSYTSQVNAMK